MSELLTEVEHEALALSGQLANKLRSIIGSGPCADADWTEAAQMIHGIQAFVMSQAAARAYPDRYRLHGRALNAKSDLGGS